MHFYLLTDARPHGLPCAWLPRALSALRALLPLLVLLLTLPAAAQNYAETFEDDATGDLDEPGEFSVTGTTDPNVASVQPCDGGCQAPLAGQVFEVSNTGNSTPVTFTTSAVTAPQAGTYVVSVDIDSEAANGAAFETADTIEILYQIGGGTAQLIQSFSAAVAPQTVTSSPIAVSAGQTLQVLVRADNSQPEENYFFDNVTATFAASSAVGALSGTVYRDLDRDDVPDAGEGAEGVTVALFGEACSTVTTSDVPAALAVTGADGSYSFGSRAAGSYCVDVPGTLKSGAVITRLNGVTKAGFMDITRETVTVTEGATTTADAEFQSPVEECLATSSDYNAIDFDALPVGPLSTPFSGFPNAPTATLTTTLSPQGPLAIFDTADPANQNADTDLETPNGDFGGTGVGAPGGVRDAADERFQNQTSRGNILISCETAACNPPDDSAQPTNKVFTFGEPVDILNVQFLDVDDEGAIPIIYVYDEEAPGADSRICEDDVDPGTGVFIPSTQDEARDCCYGDGDGVLEAGESTNGGPNDTNAACFVTTAGESCGDNCFQTIAVNSFEASGSTPARRFALFFPGSGGFAGLFYCSGGVLPVELTSFEALVDGTDALLRWQTASETNNAGFDVELRRPDAEAFERLGFVEGYGTTTQARRYAYRVADLTPGRHVFRLRQVDFDGAFAYSPEVEVVVGLTETFLIEPTYPNPFATQATLRFGVQRAQDVRVELFDVTGRRLGVLFDARLEAGQVHAQILDGRALPSGTYLVRITGETFAETQQVTLLK